MGTRSRIAIQNAASFRSIYCHWDGYLEHNGKTLAESYLQTDKVNALLDLGDISELAEHVRPPPGVKQVFDDGRIKNVCVAYADRGENDCPAQVAKSLDELLKQADESGTEYVYIFHDGVWLVTWHGEFRASGMGPGDDEASPWLPLQTLDGALLKKAEAA